MTDVKRYDLTATHDADENGVEMSDFPDGQWVKFEDYQSLASRLEGYRIALRRIADLPIAPSEQNAAVARMRDIAYNAVTGPPK
jgi:hypothetical protein